MSDETMRCTHGALQVFHRLHDDGTRTVIHRCAYCGHIQTEATDA